MRANVLLASFFSSVFQCQTSLRASSKGRGTVGGGRRGLARCSLASLDSHLSFLSPWGGGGVGEGGEKEGLLAADFFSRLTPVLR